MPSAKKPVVPVKVEKKEKTGDTAQSVSSSRMPALSADSFPATFLRHPSPNPARLVTSSSTRHAGNEDRENIHRKSLDSYSSTRHSENETGEEMSHHKSTKKLTKPNVPSSLLKPTQASERKSSDDIHQIIHEHNQNTKKDYSLKQSKGTKLKQQSSKKRSSSTPR
jgi:hypothetical protein